MKEKKSPYISLILLPALLAFLCVPLSAQDARNKTYVGPEACKECHSSEYKNFYNYSKKAHSFDSINVMKKGLTDEEFHKCFECHTTGYRRDGGFRSLTETPNLKNASCEVCHGPGSLHVETGDRKDIKGHLTAEDCEVCHNPERVKAFNYKPLINGGAH